MATELDTLDAVTWRHCVEQAMTDRGASRDSVLCGRHPLDESDELLSLGSGFRREASIASIRGLEALGLGAASARQRLPGIRPRGGASEQMGFDRTAYEAWRNSFHVDDVLEGKAPLHELVRQTIADDLEEFTLEALLAIDT